jgi:HTH-type transcriptional regulator, competence development regulator
MLTLFGKFCRKLRIDTGELLKDMANKLDVTPSYLSAVETGKRNVPIEWYEILTRSYSLSSEQQSELHNAIQGSQLSLKVDLQEMATEEKDLIMAFARELKELGEEEKKQIHDILLNNRKGAKP